jgi:hypothetical protein
MATGTPSRSTTNGPSTLTFRVTVGSLTDACGNAQQWMDGSLQGTRKRTAANSQRSFRIMSDIDPCRIEN